MVSPALASAAMNPFSWQEEKAWIVQSIYWWHPVRLWHLLNLVQQLLDCQLEIPRGCPLVQCHCFFEVVE